MCQILLIIKNDFNYIVMKFFLHKSNMINFNSYFLCEISLALTSTWAGTLDRLKATRNKLLNIEIFLTSMFFVLLKSPTLGIVGVIVAKINVLRNWNNFLVEKPNKIDILEKILFNSRSFKRKLRFNFKLELTDF